MNSYLLIKICSIGKSYDSFYFWWFCQASGICSLPSEGIQFCTSARNSCIWSRFVGIITVSQRNCRMLVITSMIGCESLLDIWIDSSTENRPTGLEEFWIMSLITNILWNCIDWMNIRLPETSVEMKVQNLLLCWASWSSCSARLDSSSFASSQASAKLSSLLIWKKLMLNSFSAKFFTSCSGKAILNREKWIR